jgi:hypothetical protein
MRAFNNLAHDAKPVFLLIERYSRPAGNLGDPGW